MKLIEMIQKNGEKSSINKEGEVFVIKKNEYVEKIDSEIFAGCCFFEHLRKNRDKIEKVEYMHITSNFPIIVMFFYNFIKKYKIP